MAGGVTILVSPIRMGSSGLEHQSLDSLMGEYGFIDGLGLTIILVVGNIEISDPSNAEHVYYTAQRNCVILTFKGPCIGNVFSSITNEVQRYVICLFLQNALHVSGRTSAHHQELKK
jgi:hypothetical protein